jgi:hypothetical protein
MLNNLNITYIKHKQTKILTVVLIFSCQGKMERSALLTAAFIQEIWLWYTVMSARRRCRGLWNSEAEKRCYVNTEKDGNDSGNSDLDEEHVFFDADSREKVSLTLSTTEKRIAHLESTIRLMRDMKFLGARYIIIVTIYCGKN